jgi:integrase
MGTISTRKRKDGTPSYTAQILRKQKGVIVWREARTFDKKREAESWIKARETELDRPGTIDKLKKPDSTLADVIDRYMKEKADIGRTKAQCLRTIKTFPIGAMDCTKIRSEHIAEFARELLAGGRKPQTVGNYISHLSAVFGAAKPLWGIDLDKQAMSEAQAALSKHGQVGKSAKRERRPTLAELDLLMQFFVDRQARQPRSAPMQTIIAFAIFSTRRQEEITLLKWADLEEDESRVLVRDMKHPGQKKGNDTWVELPSEALRIIKAQPRIGALVFPYSTDAISAAFTRACYVLGINTEEMPDEDRLHFHDLRHEGVSRLFEMGRTIPLAASVSGHRSWASLQRYAQIRKTGDKFANWKWLDIICPLAEETA